MTRTITLIIKAMLILTITSIMTQSLINLANLSSLQGFTITGPSDYNGGISVSKAGDFNNDGIDDIIIGTSSANSGAGKSYVIYGSKNNINLKILNLTSSQGIHITGAKSADNSGVSVSYAGDVNGDGIADVIIGAFGANSIAGISYLIYGSKDPADINLASLGSKQGFYISGASANDHSGVSVSHAGDCIAGGKSCVIIGAVSANSNAGISYVIYGGSSLSNVSLSGLSSAQGYSITGAVASDNSGQAVSYIGDINNDGIPDILIGAIGDSATHSATYAGVVYVIFGGATLVSNNINLASLTSSQGFMITGVNAGDLTGMSVSGAGDVNGDGTPDIIIGAPGAVGGVNSGAVYVVYGGSPLTNNKINLASLTSSQGFTIMGMSNSYTGYSVSGGGNINGDKNPANNKPYDDIIVGAYGANSETGQVFVIYGGGSIPSSISLAHLSSIQGFTVSGINAGDKTGISVSNAGDVNTDGYDDILIGAQSVTSGAWVSYVIYGAASGFRTTDPSNSPTILPTINPSGVPSMSPTGKPSCNPTIGPNFIPSFAPSFSPTDYPSLNPIRQSTIAPSYTTAPNINSSPLLTTAQIISISAGGAATILSGTLILASKSICIAAFDSWTPRMPATLPENSVKNLILYPCKWLYSSAYIQVVKDRDFISVESATKHHEQGNDNTNTESERIVKEGKEKTINIASQITPRDQESRIQLANNGAIHTLLVRSITYDNPMINQIMNHGGFAHNMLSEFNKQIRISCSAEKLDASETFSYLNPFVAVKVASSSMINYFITTQATNFVYEHLVEVLSQEKKTAFDTVKYCSYSIIAHTLPSIATCALATLIFSDIGCHVSVQMLANKALPAIVDCYQVYKLTGNQPFIENAINSASKNFFLNILGITET